MSTDPREPSLPTVKMLFAKSGNQCAFPGCSSPRFDPDTGACIGVVSHITDNRGHHGNATCDGDDRP